MTTATRKPTKQQIIDTQAARIRDLEARIAALEERIYGQPVVMPSPFDKPPYNVTCDTYVVKCNPLMSFTDTVIRYNVTQIATKTSYKDSY